MLDLLKNGQFVRQVPAGVSLKIPDVDIMVFPAMAGWSFGEYSLVQSAPPPEPVPPTPEEILASLPSVSLAQMIASLVIYEILTEAEGEAWILGTLPEDVLTVIASLPPEAQFVAKLRAIRPTEVSPRDILVPALAAMKGKTTEDLIEIFQLAATL